MRHRALDVSDLRVESFDVEALPGDEATALELLNAHTRWPKDCAETLPQFC